ncbi:sensor histidine kinase [Marilutibacter aestuarii]|uniref:histidine kinase n=1 Tax=Marilutibacter aestuarii TaxID=1706195 RepID=A0A508AHF3_9GAMM|nr:ATP-binding protein [Lysobacter aestuarii]TQD48323.1 PAS domain S-box protein [Lysobacter aestuarii]
MPFDFVDNWSRWRLPVLVFAVLLIVVAPFLLLRDAHQDNVSAVGLANHTREVENTVQSLAYEMRSLESATLSLVAGLDSEESLDGELLKQRLQQGTENVRQLSARLQTLTRDNPDQQVRVGELNVMIRQRLEITESILQEPSVARQRRETAAMISRFPIRELAQSMMDEESRLLALRDARAEALQRRTNALFWAAMIGQLVLLGLLSFFSQRQARQRLQAENAASRASARALTVLQSVREPIALIDSHQAIIMHNLAFAEMYGVEGDEALGQLLEQIGNGAWRHAELLQRLRDVLGRDRELWDFELAQQTEDGSERVMLVNARRMPLPDREDEVALLTVSDVTTQKSSERQIRELNRQLAGKVDQVSDVNRELEAFSYSVSHDLRAPLRHIAGFADKLGRQLGDDADEKSLHYLDVIAKSARRMSSLIDDLLVYSRLGRNAMRLQAVDMQSMVDETRAILDANLHSDAPGRHVEWRIGPMPILVADENMMRQVWLNLLGNAVKYSANRDPAVIEVQYQQDEEGRHHFSVRDNGAGFDMRYAGKLFGVFQRMHKASDYPGTGIGLASVRRVLTRHGGTVSADARPDEGATFTFTLPASLDQPANNEPTT